MYTNKTTNQNYQLTTNDANPNYRSSPINIPRSINRPNRFYIHNPLRRNRDRFIHVNLSTSIDQSPPPLSRNRVRSFNRAGHEIQFDDNSNYSSFNEQNIPHKVGSSTFYVSSENESSEAFSSIPTESSNYSPDDHIYETINLPSSPPENRVRSFNGVDHEIQFDDNPYYFSFDEEDIPHKVGSSTFYVSSGNESSEAFSSLPTESSNYSPDDHIYETINLPSSPPENRVRSFNGVDHEIQFDDNPYYFSFDEEDIPPEVPPKKSHMFLKDNPCYETIEESIPYMLERLRDHTEFREKYCKV